MFHKSTYLNGHFGGTFGKENPRKVLLSCSFSDTNSLKRFEHIEFPAITMSYAYYQYNMDQFQKSCQIQIFKKSILSCLLKINSYHISITIFILDMHSWDRNWYSSFFRIIGLTRVTGLSICKWK